MEGACNYLNWTLKQLQEECQRRGARRSGRKAELVQRLEAYDRNGNFGQDLDQEDDYVMSVPPLTDFRDVSNSNSTGLQQSAVMTFLRKLDATFSPGLRLYKDGFLRYLRFSASTLSGGVYYLTQCRAEMKRNVSYIVHLRKNSDGDIVETQCECAAGMGPEAHCKHVQALMLALIDVSEGKTPRLELTCTERLQNFHRPKKLHNGSPVKARKINPKKTSSFFDPRPAQFKSMRSYPDFVKNLTINFCSQEKANVPILQTTTPANMYAFDHDHHYLSSSPSDHFLHQMHIVSITPEQADRIELATIHLDDVWKSERRNRIQSSKYGQVMKAVSSEAKENLAVRLISGAEFKSKFTDHGKKYEPEAIKEYEKLTKNVVKSCGIVVSMDRPYLGATPDGLVDDDKVVEVKCPYVARNKSISPQTVPYIKKQGDVLVLDPTHDYYAQTQGQMMATERSFCHFVVYSPLPDIVVIDVPRDDLYIQQMLSKLDSFFNDFFKPAYLKYHFYKERL